MNPARVYLAQTDTTVGFLSQNADALRLLKGRSADKPFLKSFDSLEVLKTTWRPPVRSRNFVRRASRTTFVLRGGDAVRVVASGPHRDFVQKFGWCFSTSANRAGKREDVDFAKEQAQTVVFDPVGFSSAIPSKIIKLGRKKDRRFR